MPETRKHTTLRAAACAFAVCATVICMLFASSWVLQPKDNTPESGMIDYEVFGILGEPPDTIDVLVVGDSETFTSISPMLMWNDHGFTAYVCGTKKQTLPYGDTILREVTKSQHPRVVVIETNAIYAPFTLNDFLKRAAKNVFPVFEYHDRWKQLTWNDFVEAPQATWTNDLKGFSNNKNIEAANKSHHMRRTNTVQEIPPLNQWFLQNMIDYCYSIGATPIIVTTPTTKNWNMDRHDAMTAWAEQAGVTYIDFNTGPYAVDIDWEADSRDGGDHLNYYGAVKFSHAFGDYLVTEFDLPDHRQDPAYAAWNEAYPRYLELVGEA